jgi:hypothetical protein
VFNKNTKIIADVIEQYKNQVESKAPSSSINIEELIQDRCVSDASTYHLFDNPVDLQKFRKTKFDTSLFVLKLGKMPIWMPTKFKKTKKSGVADTIDEVAR